MPRLLLLTLMLVAASLAQSQSIKVLFKTVPRIGATLAIDGKVVGPAHENKIILGFNKRKNITSHTVTLSCPGYKDKVYTFNLVSPKSQTIEHRFERALNPISNAKDFIIEYDRMVSGIESGTPIGTTARWKYALNEAIDLESIRPKLTQTLHQAGLLTKESNTSNLFGSDETVAHAPDVLIAGRVDKYELTGGGSAGFAGGGVSYSSLSTINWQFFDRHSKEIFIKADIICPYDFGDQEFVQGFKSSINESLYRLLSENEDVRTKLEEYSAKRKAASEPKPDEEKEESTYSRITELLPVKPENFKSFEDIAKRAKRSSVNVMVPYRGQGSGVVVGYRGYIVSNEHLIRDAKSIQVQFVDGTVLPATVLAKSQKHDLCLLKVDSVGLAALPIAPEGYVPLERSASFSMGAPNDLSLGQTLSRGIVNGQRNIDGVEYVQTSNDIMVGNTGSAVFNAKGQIIGIVNLKLSGEGVKGLCFGINSDYLYSVLGLRYESMSTE